MSISTYEFLAILQARSRKAAKVETNAADYLDLLEAVRSSIALHHASELGAALDDASAVQTLKSLILKYTTENLAGSDYDRNALVERIYQDMAGLGVLTKYLQDPGVEEININSYNFIEIIRPTGTEYLYGNDAFASPEAARDIVKRMIRMGGKLWMLRHLRSTASSGRARVFLLRFRLLFLMRKALQPQFVNSSKPGSRVTC